MAPGMPASAQCRDMVPLEVSTAAAATGTPVCSRWTFAGGRRGAEHREDGVAGVEHHRAGPFPPARPDREPGEQHGENPGDRLLAAAREQQDRPRRVVLHRRRVIRRGEHGWPTNSTGREVSAWHFTPLKREDHRQGSRGRAPW